jgi:HAD superfamily hydrolase (TIGR01509 family)
VTQLVVLDLDDTLVDFASTREAAYEAMRSVLLEAGVDASAWLDACSRLDRPLFRQFEQGALTRRQYRIRRFSDPFGHLGLPVPHALVARLNEVFMDCVNDHPALYDDVQPVLQAMRHAGLRTAILTNGPSDGQRRKLRATGLASLVDHVVICEELGVSKPSARAFHAVTQAFSMSPAQAIMVGDSPELDYEGALAAGLQARLLDRDGRHASDGRAIIRTLYDLLPMSLPGA